MIRMSHAEHGFHDAYSTKEADEMAKAGWVKVPAKPVEPTPVEPEPEAEPRRGPGRPPKG